MNTSQEETKVQQYETAKVIQIINARVDIDRLEDYIKNKLNVDVGWSDHTVSEIVVLRAIHKWRASTVEFHLDIDGHGYEYSKGHCWLPNQIENVIRAVEDPYIIDGKKSVVWQQAANRVHTQKSIIYWCLS